MELRPRAGGRLTSGQTADAQRALDSVFGLDRRLVAATEARTKITDLVEQGREFFNLTSGRVQTFDDAKNAYEAVFFATQIDEGKLLPDALTHIWEPFIGTFQSGHCVRLFPEALPLEIKVLEAVNNLDSQIPKNYKAPVANQLGFLFFQSGNRQQSEAHFLRAIVLGEEKAREDGSWHELAGAMRNLAHRYEDWGDMASAMRQIQAATPIADRMQVENDWIGVCLDSRFKNVSADHKWQRRATRASEAHFLHVASRANGLSADESSRLMGLAREKFELAEGMIWTDRDMKALVWDEGKLAGLPGAQYCLFLFDEGKFGEVIERAESGQRADGRSRRNSAFNVNLFRMLQGLAQIGEGNIEAGTANLMLAKRKLLDLHRDDVFRSFDVEARLQKLPKAPNFALL